MKTFLKTIGALCALPILVPILLVKLLLLIPIGITSILTFQFDKFITSQKNRIEDIKFIIKETLGGNRVKGLICSTLDSTSGKSLSHIVETGGEAYYEKKQELEG